VIVGGVVGVKEQTVGVPSRMTGGSGTGTTTTSTGTRMGILTSRESLKCSIGIVDVLPTMVLVWCVYLNNLIINIMYKSYYNYGEMFGHQHTVIDVIYWLSQEVVNDFFETKEVITNLYKKVRKIKKNQVERLIDLSFWFSYRCMDYMKFYEEDKKDYYIKMAGLYDELRLDIMEYSYDVLSEEDRRYYVSCTD